MVHLISPSPSMLADGTKLNQRGFLVLQVVQHHAYVCSSVYLHCQFGCNSLLDAVKRRAGHYDWQPHQQTVCSRNWQPVWLFNVSVIFACLSFTGGGFCSSAVKVFTDHVFRDACVAARGFSVSLLFSSFSILSYAKAFNPVTCRDTRSTRPIKLKNNVIL